MQTRGEQLAEEHAELVALRHELNQRDRELSRRATEQATEAANTQVCHLCRLLYQAAPLHPILSLGWRCDSFAAVSGLGLVACTASCYADLVEEMFGSSMHMPEVGVCYSRQCSPLPWHMLTLMSQTQCQVNIHTAVPNDSMLGDSLTPCV